MGVPFTHNPSGADAAILGIPFDCGVHPFRIGSRQGPHAIRDQSRLIRPYNPELSDFNPMERLGLVDCGDVRVIPSRMEESFESIEEAVDQLFKAKTVPITMGGDGSVSYPIMRAAGKHYADLAVIHLDSHTDTTPPTADSPHNAGTQFYRAATEKHIDPKATYHIGLRGTTMLPGGFERTEGLGYNLIPLNDLLARGIDNTFQEIKEALQGRPVYICWDMDVFDPSCAPGVAAPSWGGLSAREGLQILRSLTDLNIVAFDVNTVSPNHDQGGMTAFLAAALIYEVQVLLCRQLGKNYPYDATQ